MSANNIKQQTYFTPEQLNDCPDEQLTEIHTSITEKLNDADYPCVGAKAALNSSQYRIGVYGSMGDDETTRQLGEDLKNYTTETLSAESEYMTLIAVFTDEPASELDFEQKLWQQLQRLHDSEKHLQRWDPEVSNNPEDSDFSFSFNGTAFFVVGLHAKASRRARRFTHTAMAFNLHRQFEQLREKGVYENMQKVIREREEAYDGSINPMLSNFGEGLEAPQYSGRQVDESWKCPFHVAFKHQTKKEND
ncbi:guanitoxin biosynthesis heme-dependent pre-guanitoxin N-hydroxylase GntA [Pontibacter cellulosilyticus]|uniref:YqcI/YcgG family protein n=1 Tax=Pontibacter cellulosilyticus TaxID=1720253 RepID=A0A923SJA9_9BACT|nr:guanitoxin biosynthesis heme-dependent pre-guanitoxin N-hydroxylase GntA [Pontibacter cellulosilyticus]MBC5993714.1 YqcI/YcgG family protein [Pontibacter cellulosilyticus]